MVSSDSKLMAAMSYLMITAPIVLILEKKDKYAKFHAIQATGILTLFLALRLVIIIALNTVPWSVGSWLPFVVAASLLLIPVAAYLLVVALQGKEKKLPVFYDVGKTVAGLLKVK